MKPIAIRRNKYHIPFPVGSDLYQRARRLCIRYNMPYQEARRMYLREVVLEAKEMYPEVVL